MSGKDDVVEVVQEAVRQFAEVVTKFDGPILPAIALSNAPPKIDVLVHETSVKRAHETARKLAKISAICVETWDGYATVEGVRHDAILVNYWTEGRGPVFFVQPYKRNPFEWVGGAIAGEETSRLEG